MSDHVLVAIISACSTIAAAFIGQRSRRKRKRKHRVSPRSRSPNRTGQQKPHRELPARDPGQLP